LSCNRHTARSVEVTLHIGYAIAFQFDSHLGDFPFLFFYFFQNVQSLCLGVRFSIWVSFGVSIRVTIRVSIRAGVRAVFRVTIRAKARVRLRVYLSCLLCFCQACCLRHLGSKIDTEINLSKAYDKF